MWVKALRQLLALAAVGISFAGSLLVSSLYADNRPELPDLAELRQPGSLMLHGGGRMTIEAFDCFLNLAGGPEAKIVLIPSAGYRVNDYDSLERFTSAVSRNFRTWI